MRASRGMGAVNPSKMPKAKTIVRKDNPNDVTMYAEGGDLKPLNPNQNPADRIESVTRLTGPNSKNSKGGKIKGKKK